MRKSWLLVPASLLVLILVCVSVYFLPPVHSRLAWRLANLRSQVYYYFNPPQEAVFLPQEQQIEAIVQATLQAATQSAASLPATLTATPEPSPTAPGPTPTPEPTATPTASPTPIPDSVVLNGLIHEYQQMNNCGPATLATLLSYWGWQGDQRDTRLYLRPNFASVDDKNVSPQEMVRFVQAQTGLQALWRVGGDIELLKRLIAAGFPVIVEKGFQPPKEDWMGHYQAINGYDDARGRFITQDSYVMPDLPLPYPDLQDRWWRDFNYVFVVAYPAERESDLFHMLGVHADPLANFLYAGEKAQQEIPNLQGRDLFFAWFNLGDSLSLAQDYSAAAQAFDQAFAVYAALPEEERPWRTLWYRHEPYQAYYNAGRYQDVINLANTTLAFLAQPILEESLYWRGMAKQSLGDSAGAINDLERAYGINPTSTGAADELRKLGAGAP
jgi:tetratricopeptide (TPR) repeat protein